MQKIGPNGDGKSSVATLDGRSRKKKKIPTWRAPNLYITAQPNEFAIWPPEVNKHDPSFSDRILMRKLAVSPLVGRNMFIWQYDNIIQ